MKFRLVYLVVPLALAAGLAAWTWSRRASEVEGARAQRGEAVEVVYATGFVEPRQPVQVAARVTAPIVQLFADEGARVVRGQPLARLEDSEQRAAIAQLAAQTANAESEERRALALAARGFVSGAARDRAVTAARAARATEAAARARLDQYVLRAGVSGIVLRRDAEPGELATPSRNLFVIGDPASIRITATVDERDIPRVRPGQRVLMSSDAFAGTVYHGTVHDLTPGGDSTQRTFRVRVWPDGEAARLPVGMTFEVNIVTRVERGALLVPATAIRDNAVWIAETGRARRVPVRTGIAGATRTQILGGLAPGACVIAQPPEGIGEGDRLTVRGC